MFNAAQPARPTARAPMPLKPWRAALIGLMATAPSVAIAFDAIAHPTSVQSPAVFASDRLSVEVLGQGPDVILIPGFASSREVWRAEAERLSADHRVHLVQLAGFAGERWTHGQGGPFLDPVVGELERYIRERGLERPAVIGHSMGGLLSLMLADAAPEAVSRVMSVDSLPFFGALFGPTATPATVRPAAQATAAAILSADEATFRRQQAQTAIGLARSPAAREAMVEWSMASDRQALAAAISEVMTTDIGPRLSGIHVPVTAVYAADADGGAPAAMADAMWSTAYAALPDKTLVRVDDSRHFIMADQPDRFAEVVDAFLAE